MSWLGKIQLPKSQRIYKMSKEQNWFHQKPKECCLPPDMSIAATQNSRPRPCNSQHIRRLQLDLSMAQLCPAVLANLDRPTAALQVAAVLRPCCRAAAGLSSARLGGKSRHRCGSAQSSSRNDARPLGAETKTVRGHAMGQVRVLPRREPGGRGRFLLNFTSEHRLSAD